MLLIISRYFILYILYSFLGWLLEIIDILIEEKKIVNRGFLIGPYCPIYGIGSLLLIILLSKYKNVVLIFILSIIICGIVEYLISYLLEKIFKTRWWDYSNKKYNINGRVCLKNLIGFGLFGLLLIIYINPYFLNIINILSKKTIIFIALIIFVIFIVDCIISFKIIKKFKNKSKNLKKDKTEIVKKFVQKEINK